MSGKIKLKVNPETQNGTRLRLRAKGFPVYKKEGSFGDLYITWEVKLPTNLTDKQKELFEEQLEKIGKQISDEAIKDNFEDHFWVTLKT